MTDLQRRFRPIFGEVAHTGNRTSSRLLLQLADPAVPGAYLGDDARCLVVSLLDLHTIGSDYSQR